MKTKLRFLWLIPLFFLVYGCADNSNYYEKPIKKYLRKKRDKESIFYGYESVKFIVLDSSSFTSKTPFLKYVEITVSDFRSKSFMVDDILKYNYSPDYADNINKMKAIQKSMDDIIKKNNMNINEFIRLKDLNPFLSSSILELWAKLMVSYLEALKAGDYAKSEHYSWLSNSIQHQLQRLDDSINKWLKYGVPYGLLGNQDGLLRDEKSLEDISISLQNGLLIYNEYKRKEANGEKTLHKVIFELDSSRKFVEHFICLKC
jgi:hypothetical protein